MVKQNGKVVEVAVFEKSCELDLNIVMRKGIHLIGSWGWVPLEFLDALTLMKTGKVDRKPLITHTFPLAEAKQAYETQLNAREAIKVVINP
jgi:threonine dehydrogenase-like Zn-dependent dehydrogenase